jgi:hypothetical protein
LYKIKRNLSKRKRYESKGDGKVMFQLNARISEEARQQLDSIVEYYRSNLPIGKVSKAEVLQDLIKKTYEQIEKQKKLKAK